MDFASTLMLIAVGIAWLTWWFIIPLYQSPLWSLRGPPAPSWFNGHFKQISTVRNSLQMQEWVAAYGPSFLVRWFGMMPCLWTIDPVTIAHILSHAYDYEKPLEGRLQVARLIAKSILVSEGELHRKMRKIMNPAFGTAQIRRLHEVFVDKAADLRELWKGEILDQGGRGHMNIVDGLGRATLEVIGVAGFNYQLGSLSSAEETNELNHAFRATFKNPPKFSFIRVIMEMFPLLDFFPSERTKNLREAKRVTDRIGAQLLEERKAMIRSEVLKDTQAIQSQDVAGRDLLTLLVKSNMAMNIPENQRLSDEEVLAQIPTFLIAGHETSSTALAWCLYAISQAPEVQEKLRRELLAMGTDVTPSLDELAALPYLDAVVRETLRVYGPLTTTLRAASRDDVLPISKPFKDSSGKIRTEIRIAKGNRIIIPLMAMNQSQALWGNDAFEFKPERWEKASTGTEGVPGVWGNSSSFGYGPRACIGFRFAVDEMKVFLYTLVRAFEFEPATSPGDVARTGTVVQRPSLLSQPDKGTQLPLFVKEHVIA
ncbi:cytochrome P450 [Peniophora sp. CONT]|nr:cytochrome P450 [Peniophora sp. CONT]